MNSKTISTIGLRSVLVGLASLGANTGKILNESSLEREIIDDPDGRISLIELNKFWEVCAHHLNDNLIAINLSRFIPFGTFQITDHLLSSASFLEEGLTRYLKYYSIVNQNINLEMSFDTHNAILTITPIQDKSLTIKALDFELGLICSRLKIVTNNKISFEKINIPYGDKSLQERYEKVLDAPIFFNPESLSIVFSKKYLRISCSESNSNLFDFIEQNAKSYLEKLKEVQSKLPEVDQFLEDFYELIRANLKDGDFSIEAISKNLNMSVRTLQRKLKDYNLSFKEVLVEIRKEISMNLLQDHNLSIAEIAYLTGFSESSAFHRAFKQWTGQTPVQFRKED